MRRTIVAIILLLIVIMTGIYLQSEREEDSSVSVQDVDTFESFVVWDVIQGAEFAGAGGGSAINISTCSVLDQSGATYYLNQSIINHESPYCMNISANNIVLDCQGFTIDGDDHADYGIYVFRDTQQDTNITIQNCVLSDWDTSGFYLYRANGNRIINCTARSNPIRGMFLRNSDYNNITNCSATTSIGYGISLWDGSNNNNIQDCVLTLNYDANLAIEDSDSNIVSNCTLTDSSSLGGIYLLAGADSNTIANSTIANNIPRGIYIHWTGADKPSSNLIYNNLLNNTVNVAITQQEEENYWNTTKQTGDRIYSAGTEIGGNYWTNSTGNGYSDTCTDADQDGFCDNYYNLTSNNIDWLPLSSGDWQGYTHKGSAVKTILSYITNRR